MQRNGVERGSATSTLPSFVTERAGDGMRREPRALDDVHRYVANAVRRLAPA